jgi:glycosyltransferase involved in cell wall biosynthesis
LIANLTGGKGVEPFLRALSEELAPGDTLQLTIAGSLEADPAYARACQSFVATQPELAERVTFTGALSPSSVVTLLSTSNLLVSASRMESFGMAIAEARTLGVPVLARTGGNTAALVDAAAGGHLVDGDGELARACCRLARDHRAHARALGLAQGYPRPPRDFAQAARDFVSQLSSSDADRAR